MMNYLFIIKNIELLIEIDINITTVKIIAIYKIVLFCVQLGVNRG